MQLRNSFHRLSVERTAWLVHQSEFPEKRRRGQIVLLRARNDCSIFRVIQPDLDLLIPLPRFRTHQLFT